jgi:hypothetical protein
LLGGEPVDGSVVTGGEGMEALDPGTGAAGETGSAPVVTASWRAEEISAAMLPAETDVL